MSLISYVVVRRFATSIARTSILSSEYKSSELWKERFQCPIICNNDTIRTINNKILAGTQLSNLELDIFINVARPSNEDKAQLQEAAKLLSDFRKTLMAHRLLPSTPHAICRLFLDSHSIPSLVTLLDNRVKFGVFSDSFMTNLLIDTALDSNQYALASKIASFVMLQEEFGINPLTDKLSLISLVQYVDSLTNFEDWPKCDPSQDPVLSMDPNNVELRNEDQSQEEAQATQQEKRDDDGEEDEDEDDAEYIRVPFLRNPYFDNHFDVENPRIICGKTLSALGRSLSNSSPELSRRIILLGNILQGLWDESSTVATECKASNIGFGGNISLLKHYIENLHSIEAPTDKQKAQLSKNLEALPDKGPSLLEMAKAECENLTEHETKDISELKNNLKEWSRVRERTKQAQLMKSRRDQLIAEIEAKKKELKLKEDYLYFYDNLKKSKITRIEYN